jgi:protoheme IX farnesyltransferase
MNPAAASLSPALPAEWRDFLALTKPRVMSLVVFTGLCGLLAAPGHVHPVIGFTAILCIAVASGACGALNMWYEADLDRHMKRTMNRPLPAGRMDRPAALQFGVALAVGSVVVMGLAVNLLSAFILAVSILFYVVVYTVWLKRRTPQNIVIGGAAGAFPVLIGWAAACGRVDALPVLMFLAVFLWTPPHFWSLALFVRPDYAAAGVPMLPVVRGDAATRRQVLLYAIPMACAAVAPWPLGLTGAIYGGVATLLNGWFVALALAVSASREADPAAMRSERALFRFSILYLFLLFSALVADRLVLS